MRYTIGIVKYDDPIARFMLICDQGSYEYYCPAYNIDEQFKIGDIVIYSLHDLALRDLQSRYRG